MAWSDEFTPEVRPEMEQINNHINSPLWQELRGFIEATYGVSPSIEYSRCAAAPGWNVKYKKSSRALCTLYPHCGYFTAMVSLGRKEADGAEALLPLCEPYIQELYKNAQPFNGSRWLMIDVTTAGILADVKNLITLRAPLKTKK